MKPTLKYTQPIRLKTLTKDGEMKRFIIGLEYLSDPEFLGLLDQAKEEYGFMHKGAIAVPCQPQQLQNIIDGQR
jgi:SAUR family protein